MKNTFDYIIAGGGCAGLSLAYSLLNSSLKNQSILIIDLDSKKSNDRTWCYWTEQPTHFDHIVHRSWSKLAFADDKGELVSEISPLRYEMIKGIDFYDYMWSEISKHPNVEFLHARISGIGCNNEQAYVVVGQVRFFAKKVFDSCFNLGRLQSIARNDYHFQLQHFLGWVIETKENCFTSDVATIMDFRTEQEGQTRFFYVLPLSQNKALVEFTIFSSNLLNKNNYEKTIKKYLNEQLNIQDYTVKEEEYGIIPMTDAPFPEHPSPHIIPIGIKGNGAKPTTGYAFIRIQEQVKEITTQLEQNYEQIRLKSSKQRFKFYDTLLLHILEYNGAKSKYIFSRLFRHNPFKIILSFLDERTSIWNEMSIFASLPFIPFLKALYQTKIKTRKNKRYKELISSQNQRA